MAVFAEASWELISNCQLLPLPGAQWSLAECSLVSVGKFWAAREDSPGKICDCQQGMYAWTVSAPSFLTISQPCAMMSPDKRSHRNCTRLWQVRGWRSQCGLVATLTDMVEWPHLTSLLLSLLFATGGWSRVLLHRIHSRSDQRQGFNARHCSLAGAG